MRVLRELRDQRRFPLNCCDMAEQRATNITWHGGTVTRADRERLLGQRGVTVWLTGLSAAGKSTIAVILERMLLERGRHTYRLDGDNVRHGLNRDLGFTEADRVENIRRVGEVAKLITEAGIVVLCSFISPYRAERDMVRGLVAAGDFIEVFVDAPIEECIRRDPKGLYAKAKAGKIKNFTGIDAPYEPPSSPELRLPTANRSPEQLAEQVVTYLADHGILGQR